MQLARCSLAHPERDTNRLLAKKLKLSLEVERSHLEGFPHIPILPLRNWFQFFIENSCMHILHGLRQPHPKREEDILEAFWGNYRDLCPNHQVFQQEAEGKLELRRAIPLLVHGDEGRGRRHVGHFVLSFHSILGQGFQKMKRKRSWARMLCNFEGHSFTTRFLLATMRKRDYSDQMSGVWEALMDTVALECRFMWETGVADMQNKRYWGIVVSIVGDWPFLHKCAGFSRSFNTVQKRVTVRNPPQGLCHLCQAGQNDYPFEQIATKRPAWVRTMFQQDPFVQTSPFEVNLLHELGKAPDIWAFDWFHTMHLGVLRVWLGSVLALLSQQEPFGSIDDRFAALSKKYKDWCHENRKTSFIAKISKESINWEKTSLFPTGSWHKGALSTILMEYCEARFLQETFPNEELLGLAAQGTFAIQRLSRFLYRSEVWLTPSESKLASDLGAQFLRRFDQAATLSRSQGRCFFVFQPKIHVLHHFVVAFAEAYTRGVKALNPLSRSCQQSEDFIGRPSRVSRRVTPRTPALHRIMDRYLQSAYSHFIRAQYLVRSGS